MFYMLRLRFCDALHCGNVDKKDKQSSLQDDHRPAKNLIKSALYILTR